MLGPFSFKFTQWFPQFRPYFVEKIDTVCASVLHEYETKVDPWANYHANLVVSCILENFDEAGKAQLATSSVLLGLMPTILGMVGSNTTEVGLLAQRHPILATLVSVGAPVISPIRSFEYRDPLELLWPKEGGKKTSRLVVWFRKWFGEWFLRPLAYVCAIGAVLNTSHVVWQLCMYSPIGFSASSNWIPGLWFALSIIPHICGIVAVKLRVIFVPPESLLTTLKNEFTPGEEKAGVKLLDTSWSEFCTWLASFCTILHLVMGTVVLASALFISPSDSVVVSMRLFGSAVVCRVFLIYMIHVMGEAITKASTQNPLTTGNPPGP